MTAAKAGPTPGPLTILRATKSSDGGIDYAVMATIDGEPRCIGEAFEVVDHGVRMPAEANARLWAAAPTLLAELRALRKRFHACCMFAGNSAEIADLACSSADAAIAKAESRR